MEKWRIKCQILIFGITSTLVSHQLKNFKQGILEINKPNLPHLASRQGHTAESTTTHGRTATLTGPSCLGRSLCSLASAVSRFLGQECCTSAYCTCAVNQAGLLLDILPLHRLFCWDFNKNHSVAKKAHMDNLEICNCQPVAISFWPSPSKVWEMFKVLRSGRGGALPAQAELEILGFSSYFV